MGLGSNNIINYTINFINDCFRFNGTALLERLRNKRMVFVGDSLNRGQWVSMVCLLQTSMANSSRKSFSMHNNGSNLIKFKVKVSFLLVPFILLCSSLICTYMCVYIYILYLYKSRTAS